MPVQERVVKIPVQIPNLTSIPIINENTILCIQNKIIEINENDRYKEILKIERHNNEIMITYTILPIHKMLVRNK